MALLLRLPDNPNSHRRDWRSLEQAAAQLPFDGESIEIEFAPSLTAHRGKLLVSSGLGTPVYAATFLRSRKVVLEQQLLANRQMLLFFLTHELFHFAWARLGNRKRSQFTALISAEAVANARGEIAESSEVAKVRWMKRSDSSSLWRYYLCESFCDTGASILFPVAQSHTLGSKWMGKRQRWFEAAKPLNGWPC